MSEESLKKVISSLDIAIKVLSVGDFELAKQHLHRGIEESDCSVCKLELSILEADIDHNEKMCVLGADTCKEESNVLIEKAKELKKDFEDAQRMDL